VVVAAERTVSVNLKANIAGYIAPMRAAAVETKKFAAEGVAATGKQRKDFDLLGKGMLAVGTAAAAGLGMAVKAAIDWESAWAGVEKTVDGNATQMAQLESELRGLATTLPATHDEIAGVAEAAGQLGIKRESIAGFTETMIALGVATDLTADQAATSIAQISTVMGTSQDDVDRFGAALVALGNDGASTESEILMMAQRIAGAGNQIGLTETDVLGFASALSSVGIEAEAGGSSISTTMVKIATAVNDGGDALDTFAEVAGVSGKEFKQQFETDAAGAITKFVEGLGRMQQAGGDVFGVLSELGLSEIRTRDAMLRLAGAGDMLRESIALGSDAWQENTALTDEAEKRYDTVASKIQIAWNNIKDAAIDAGSAIAPVIGAIADVVGTLAGAIDLLPGPIQDALGLLGGIATAAALAGGAFLLFAPRIAATKRAMNDLGVSMGGFGKKAALASAGILAISLASSALDAALASAPAEMEALATGMERWADSGKLAGESARVFGDDADKLKEALNDVSDSGFTAWLARNIEGIPLFGSALGGLDQSVAESTRILSEADTALANMVKDDNAAAAAAGFEKIAKFAHEQGIPLERLNEIMPQYAAALEVVDAKTARTARATDDAVGSFEDLLGLNLEDGLGRVAGATDAAALTVETLAGAFGFAGENAEEQAKNVEKMLGDWADAFAEFVPMVGAYEEALKIKQEAERESAEKTAESTEDSKDSWEDYVGDVTVSVDEYLEQLERMVKDQEEWSVNMIDLAGRIPDRLLQDLADMGPEGAGLVGLLGRMTQKELNKWAKGMEETGGEGAAAFAQKLAEAGPVLRAIGAELGSGTAEKVRSGMRKRKTDVFTEAKRLGITIDDGLNVKKTRVVKTDLDGKKAVTKAGDVKDLINELLGGVEDETVTVKLNFDSKGVARDVGGARLNAAGNIYEAHQAEIAPGGAWRVWAEPETGGEAYIPLAASKRQRSMGILGQVAEKFGVGLMPFADGGSTIKLRGSIEGYNSAVRDAEAIVAKLAQSMATAGLLAGGPGIAGGLAFALSQRGKPYGWGAVGPGAYDCSGFMSAITNVILGRNPYSRLGSTASFPWGGFAPGPGAFMIGSTRNAGGGIGHMAGTAMGVNVESRGGDGVVVGPGARGAMSGLFGGNVYHLMANGGILEGDPPFDQLDPRGMHYGRGFRYGTDYVPWDGMYRLHRGEQVSNSGSSRTVSFIINGPVYGDRRQIREMLVSEFDKLKEAHRV
jgi:TP901 family phage tail tape measure protein